MIKVAITGEIGSGKSYCAEIFEQLSVPVFYSDDVARKLINTILPLKMAISKEFGRVYNENGKIDSKLLSKKVFLKGCEDNLKKLNSIVHPYVIDEYVIFCEKYKNDRYTIIESALIYETDLIDIVDEVIYVDTTLKVRMDRAWKRSGVTSKEYEVMTKGLISSTFKLSKSDHVIFNNPWSIDINEQILEIHNSVY
jgi:dephospho-CoA kinase